METILPTQAINESKFELMADEYEKKTFTPQGGPIYPGVKPKPDREKPADPPKPKPGPKPKP